MAKIKVDNSDLQKWAKAEMRRLKKSKGAVMKYSVDGENFLKKRVKKYSHSSKLHNSILSKDRSTLRSIVINLTSKAEYAWQAMEYGRKPGRMPPPRALERWAASKLGSKGAAIAVARKIAREGTEKYKKGGPKDISKTYEFMYKDSQLRKLARRLVDIWGK